MRFCVQGGTLLVRFGLQMSVVSMPQYPLTEVAATLAGPNNTCLGVLTRWSTRRCKRAAEHMLMESGDSNWSFCSPSLVQQILMTGEMH